MTSYPSGAMQNHAPPFAPPDLRPVGEQNWKMFSTLADAQIGLEMIQSVCPDAQMRDATEGQYSQFVYFDPNPDIRARLVSGTVFQGDGQPPLAILEFPSAIYDAFQNPRPFIDAYAPGMPHYLRVRAATPEIGELYWAG